MSVATATAFQTSEWGGLRWVLPSAQPIQQIDQVTQQNTANAEESAAAAEELSGQAAQMREMLQKFTLSREKAPRTSHVQVQAKHRVPQQRQIVVGQSDGWDRMNTSAAAKPNIALDDDEFGKF